VIEGCAPHAEDEWTTLRARGRHIPSGEAVRPLLGGGGGPEAVVRSTPAILKVLATYRTVDGEILFGQNAVHDGEGTLRVGDEVEVESRAR
jgi:hypothetical protein